MGWTAIGLKIAELVIVKGLNYLVEHPKYGIGNKLAKFILEAASKSKHNPIEDTMLDKAMSVL